MGVIQQPETHSLDPLFEYLPTGLNLYRCHFAQVDPLEFTTSDHGRFRPIYRSHQKLLATAYFSTTTEGSLSETVFRDVPFNDKNPRVLQ